MINIDNTAPNYRLNRIFFTEEELSQIISDLEGQSEESWNLEFESNYPKEHEVSPSVWQSMVPWKGMSINLADFNGKIYDSLNRDFYIEVLKKAKAQVEERFSTKVKMEQFLLNRWRVGRYQDPHIDYFLEHEDNNPEIVDYFSNQEEFFEDFKQNFKTKNFSTIIYINDDFEGGELYFSQYDNLELKPEANSAISFKGDTNHMHGVKTVTDGVRHTISLFWTEVE
jgi:RNAse (barnase) inhibitor barstar